MSSIRCLFIFEIPLAAGFVCRPHVHACTELVFNDLCEGTLVDDNRRYPYRHNSITIYQPGTTHWIENTVAGKNYCIGVNGCGASELPAGVVSGLAGTLALFERIFSFANGNDPLRLEEIDLLAGQLVLSLRRAGQKITSQSVERSPSHELKNIIDTNFQQPINLARVASSLFVNQEYLRQLFRESFGDSPMNYIIRKRIELACDRLKMTDKPIHEIAHDCGIANQYYFSRLFKKVMGCSPSEYRK